MSPRSSIHNFFNHSLNTGSSRKTPSLVISMSSRSARAVFIRVMFDSVPRLYSSRVDLLPKSVCTPLLMARIKFNWCEVRPFGLFLSVCEILSFNRHAVNKCPFHNSLILWYSACKITKNNTGTQLCGPQSCVPMCNLTPFSPASGLIVQAEEHYREMCTISQA